MTFPLPERGVARYECIAWADDEGGEGWECHSADSSLKLVRRDLYNMTLLGRPAYIFTRKRGKIIETNEEALRELEDADEDEPSWLTEADA
ncbi:MAG: hypothetical protein QF615_10410 [Planctomycetota bacterium]|nr:hypothetical protein [Planctomycetota bacterium]